MKTIFKRWGDYWNQPKRVAYLFLALPLLALVIFVFVPLVLTLVLSFTDVTIFFDSVNFVGLDNFVRFFSDNRAINSIGHTFYYVICFVPLQIFVSLVLASLLTKDTLFNRICRSVFYVPVVCSIAATSIVWSMILNKYFGIIPYLINQLGLISPEFLANPTLAMPTIAVISVWKGFGQTMMILLTSILAISKSLYEAAEIDGASKTQQFFKITIPQIMPTLGFCLLTSFIGSMQVFDQVYIMTGGGPLFKTETAVQYIYNRGFNNSYELGYASTVSWMLFMVIALGTVLINMFIARKEKQFG